MLGKVVYLKYTERLKDKYYLMQTNEPPKFKNITTRTYAFTRDEQPFTQYFPSSVTNGEKLKQYHSRLLLLNQG